MRSLSLCLILAARAAYASDPVGVYALVDQVAFEPDASTATRARIQGWFVIATGKPGDGDVYTAPARGYLYYQCPQGMEATCRMEWMEIAQSACGGGCVGFGSRYLYAMNGTVRPLAQAPANPDPYPIQTGVTTMGVSQMMWCATLGGAANGQPSACGAAVDMAQPAPADAGQAQPDLASPPVLAKSGCALGGGAPSGAAALLALVAAALIWRRRIKSIG